VGGARSGAAGGGRSSGSRPRAAPAPAPAWCSAGEGRTSGGREARGCRRGREVVLLFWGLEPQLFFPPSLSLSPLSVSLARALARTPGRDEDETRGEEEEAHRHTHRQAGRQAGRLVWNGMGLLGVVSPWRATRARALFSCPVLFPSSRPVPCHEFRDADANDRHRVGFTCLGLV
jgi:hypothetical protein